MQQPGGQTLNGRAPISNGGPGTTGLPAGDGPLFEGRKSYVTWLFQDMLHSTKSTNFS